MTFTIVPETFMIPLIGKFHQGKSFLSRNPFILTSAIVTTESLGFLPHSVSDHLSVAGNGGAWL